MVAGDREKRSNVEGFFSFQVSSLIFLVFPTRLFRPIIHLLRWPRNQSATSSWFMTS